jgi:hypothetical protein
VSAHNLPLPRFLGENQGSTTMECHRLPVLGYAHERVVCVRDGSAFVNHAARELTKTEVGTAQSGKCGNQEVDELFLVVEAIRYVIEDLEILG